MKQINVVVFQFKLLGYMRIHHVFHVFLLEPYHAFTIPRRVHDPLSPIEVDGEHEYEMDFTFWIQKSLIDNSNILFISMGMMWASAFGNLSITYQMPWKKCIAFFNNIQTNPSPFLMELVAKKGGDVMNANAMAFIHLNVYPWLVINLYLTFSLVSIQLYLSSS